MTINGICRRSSHRGSNTISALPGDEQIFLALGALARSVRRGGNFQCVTGKFLPFRVKVKQSRGFLWAFNEMFGIDRCTVSMYIKAGCVVRFFPN